MMRRDQPLQRRRRYVSPLTLTLMWPLVRHSPGRQAYVLRLVGNSVGPVLRRDHRRGKQLYEGCERRQPLLASLIAPPGANPVAQRH
jgi:hypothetical protein